MAIDTRALAALDELRAGFTGQIIVPGDPDFDAARTIFNAMIDKRPAVIALCESAADVVTAVRFAREHLLEFAVRGGGHSVAGKSLTDGGLVIDLRRMNGVVVDPERRTATVAGGATMRDLDRATEPFDLVTTGGRVSTTGVGGYTLGGGSGWLDRKFGLACDNLLAAELVLADRPRTGQQRGPPDLFWALHGGGGNFGVATSFTFQLHPLPSVTAALLLWRPEVGPDVARTYRDFIDSAPDEVGGLIYLTGPAEDFVPAHLVGRLTCAVFIAYSGPEVEARRAIAPILELGHDGELIVEVPYAELQCMLDDPPGYRNYWSVEYLDAFPDEAVDRFCARAGDMVVPSPSQHVLFSRAGQSHEVRSTTRFQAGWRHGASTPSDSGRTPLTTSGASSGRTTCAQT